MPAVAPTVDEIEWQFNLPSVDRAVEWLNAAAIPGYTVIHTGLRKLSDTYLDTEDWRLNRAGFTCRVRHFDGAPTSELTLKTIADLKDGARSRKELNEEVAHDDPFDLTAAKGETAKTIRLVAGPSPVRPLFTIRQERHAFELADEAGVLGEITVDDTAVVDRSGAVLPIPRLEVEIAPDALDRTKRFTEVLAVGLELEEAKKAKYAAAVELTGATPVLPEKTLGPTDVREDMTIAQVAFAVMRKHFATFLANEAGTRLGQDIEALHDMRVAARRLRAAMQTFRPYLPERFERHRGEFGWVGKALGVVRDLDVQLERMEEWREDSSDEQAHALDAIERLLEQRREKGRTQMLRTLNSRRYNRFVERFAAVLRRGPSRAFKPGRALVLAEAPGILEKRHKKVRKLGNRIDRSSPPADYHLVRIECKKLRYALEFVGPVYGKSATDFAQRLSELQDILGLHQDAEVAVEMLHDMATASGRRLGPQTVLAMGAIAERYRIHAEELRSQFPKRYKGITGAEWKTLHSRIEDMAPPKPSDDSPPASNGR